MTPDRDELFAEAREPVDFRFDEAVARVFPDMVRRSVPGYDAQLAALAAVAREYPQPQTVVYDLGCSLGAATLAMRPHLTAPGVTMVAVDNSPAMLDRARTILEAQPVPPGTAPVQLVEADVTTLPLEPTSLVVMNYTLQFIPLEQRAGLLFRIHDALVPGGALVLAEKVCETEPWRHAQLDALHLAYKRANGYRELEIAQKRSALERVLLPETPATHHARLREVGFARVTEWFRCLNFVSFLAVK